MNTSSPRFSVVVPFHWMGGWEKHLLRCLKSIEMQSVTDYEIILMKVSTFPITSNRLLSSARGELIKFLCVDDYLAHGESLREISDQFTNEVSWLVTGCLHQKEEETPQNYHSPRYTEDIHAGNNRIGAPSVLTLRREGALLFDENLSWLVDCDLYKRLHTLHGLPQIIDTPNVVIGIHDEQNSNLLPDKLKKDEHYYVMDKYSKV